MSQGELRNEEEPRSSCMYHLVCFSQEGVFNRSVSRKTPVSALASLVRLDAPELRVEKSSWRVLCSALIMISRGPGLPAKARCFN